MLKPYWLERSEVLENGSRKYRWSIRNIVTNEVVMDEVGEDPAKRPLNLVVSLERLNNGFMLAIVPVRPEST